MSIFTTVIDDVENFFTTLPASVQTLVTKLKTDAGQMAQQLAAKAAADITTGGILNTTAYVTAAKDILAQLPSDAGILLTDVFSILNAEVSYLLSGSPAAPTVASTTPDTASAS